MTSLACLSPEIIVEVIKMLGFHDIDNVIQASPLFLQHFLVNRHQILKESVNKLNDLSLVFTSAFWLRYQTPEIPFTKSEVQDAEQTSPRPDYPRLLDLSTSNKLSLLSCAHQLLVEAEWIADGYAPQAWSVMQRDAEPYEQLQDFQVMSTNEKKRIVESALHFEVYCRKDFVDRKIRFTRNESKCWGFFLELPTRSAKYTALYSILYYVFDQYLRIISNATANLSALNESRQKYRFEQQTRREILNFAHYLTSRGIGLLYRIQCMDSVAQAEHMVEWFYEVSRSRDLLVQMDNGTDIHREGTLEARQWEPWEGIDLESHPSSASWRSGVVFWDHTVEERNNRISR